MEEKQKRQRRTREEMGYLKLHLNDDFWIEADSYQFNLVIRKQSSNGTEMMKTLGHYSSLEGLMKGFIRHKIKQSKVDTLQDLIDEVKDVKKFLEEKLKGI